MMPFGLCYANLIRSVVITIIINTRLYICHVVYKFICNLFFICNLCICHFFDCEQF